MGGLAVLFLIGLYFILTIVAIVKIKPVWAKGLVLLAALLVPTADAVYGRYELKQMCATEAGLKVYRVAHGVEGFMGYASEEMITRYGYQFVEERNPPSYYRFSKQNDLIVREDNVTPKSEYRVRQVYGNNKDIYSRSQYIIENISTGEVLASDTVFSFRGGWVERILDRLDGNVGGRVALCSNLPDSLIRIKNLITSTLKHSGE